ncbi:MAG: AraC family transcriptional regulator [Alphaproteobacteria bacterium]|nr:AraC family transcriptional regulator [Alphaproteobacteria bacterium]MDA7984070.1 AraC family transcriptional regulator [Alphaproteobacteria bacterium]MDA7987162.1 AraC family transcriptional regulator [Alphaproteobacteria bacterium]MDA7988593.1 AraC family transcriptional regulator [Alphaproteobacteria bacterium]MDA8009020.1 AraC family transcriptional regulator [Alphaproteobacteria bacterium]
MSIILPEVEYVDRTSDSIRYLQHGWPSELCRWHSHREYELHLVVETHGKAFIGDYIGDFSPGSLFLTGPHLPHNWVTDKVRGRAVEIRDMLVQFDKESITRLARAFPEFAEMTPMLELAGSGIEFEDFDAQYADDRLSAIRDSAGAESIMALLEFLLRLNAHPKKKSLSVKALSADAATRPDEGGTHARIAEVVDHVTNNFYDETISLATAAEMACLSPAAFSRNFHRITGNRFVEFVNRVRVGQACAMLYATDKQVSAICYEVGYRNLANFNRHFVKMKQMTPTAYREAARSGLTRKDMVH